MKLRLWRDESGELIVDDSECDDVRNLDQFPRLVQDAKDWMWLRPGCEKLEITLYDNRLFHRSQPR